MWVLVNLSDITVCCYNIHILLKPYTQNIDAGSHLNSRLSPDICVSERRNINFRGQQRFAAAVIAPSFLPLAGCAYIVSEREMKREREADEPERD